MPLKRQSNEGVSKLLHDVDAHIDNGLDVVSACRKSGISDKTYHYRCKKFGDMGRPQVSEMRALQKEIDRLNKVVLDLQIDNKILKEGLAYLKDEGLMREQLYRAVIHARKTLETSERRTCAVLGIARSSLRYQSRPANEDALRLAMVRLARQYGRHGVRKITALLREEGWPVNLKKIGRLWDEEGLKVPNRRKKRRSLFHSKASVAHIAATHPRHVWIIDIVQDQLSTGCNYKIFTVLDEYTNESLCVEAHVKMNANDVLDTLHGLVLKHGKPEFIRSNTGSKFIASPLKDWLRRAGIQPM